MLAFILLLYVPWIQTWEVTKHKYFITVLKQFFLVFIFLTTFYFDSLQLNKYLYFLLLHFQNGFVTLVLMHNKYGNINDSEG